MSRSRSELERRHTIAGQWGLYLECCLPYDETPRGRDEAHSEVSVSDEFKSIQKYCC